MCDIVIPELLDAFDIKSFSISDPLFEFSIIEPMPMPLVSPEALARFSVRLIEEGRRDMFDKFIAKLTSQVTEAHPRDLVLLYIPFIRTLVEILEKADTPLTLPTYQRIFRTVFTSLLDRWVGKEPPQPSDLCVKPVACRCEDCKHLNAFLTNPSQLEYVFRGTMERFHHLDIELRTYGIPCKHEVARLTACNKVALRKEFREYDGAKEGWERRKLLAEREVDQFSQARLKTFLGEDEYHRIMAMDGYMAPDPPDRTPPTEYHSPHASCENKEKFRLQAAEREKQAPERKKQAERAKQAVEHKKQVYREEQAAERRRRAEWEKQAIERRRQAEREKQAVERKKQAGREKWAAGDEKQQAEASRNQLVTAYQPPPVSAQVEQFNTQPRLAPAPSWSPRQIQQPPMEIQAAEYEKQRAAAIWGQPISTYRPPLAPVQFGQSNAQTHLAPAWSPYQVQQPTGGTKRRCEGETEVSQKSRR